MRRSLSEAEVLPSSPEDTEESFHTSELQEWNCTNIKGWCDDIRTVINVLLLVHQYLAFFLVCTSPFSADALRLQMGLNRSTKQNTD